MRRLLPLLAGGALLLLLALGGAWFLENFERVEDQIEIGYHGEARRNPYLAAQRFLEAAGGEAHSVTSLELRHRLPPPEATIILPIETLMLGEGDRERLHDWIAAGGHLVTVIWSDPENGVEDPLLGPLGIGQEIQPEEADCSATLTRPLAAPGTGEPLQATFRSCYTLVDRSGEANWAGDGDHGSHILHLPHGRGAVTALSDGFFLENDEISDHDHAALLWHLAHWEGREGTVWLVYGDDMPPLWLWLWQRAPELVISAAALLLPWLWGASRRFGPLLPEPLPERRSLREHLRASGRFLWRQRQREPLAEPARTALMETLARRRPHWLQLPPGERLQKLATLAGLDPREVAAALAPATADTPERFIRRIHTLEAIRNKL